MLASEGNIVNNKYSPIYLLSLIFCIWADVIYYGISLWLIWGLLAWLCPLPGCCPPSAPWNGRAGGDRMLRHITDAVPVLFSSSQHTGYYQQLSRDQCKAQHWEGCCGKINISARQKATIFKSLFAVGRNTWAARLHGYSSSAHHPCACLHSGEGNVSHSLWTFSIIST